MPPDAVKEFRTPLSRGSNNSHGADGDTHRYAMLLNRCGGRPGRCTWHVSGRRPRDRRRFPPKRYDSGTRPFRYINFVDETRARIRWDGYCPDIIPPDYTYVCPYLNYAAAAAGGRSLMSADRVCSRTDARWSSAGRTAASAFYRILPPPQPTRQRRRALCRRRI